jgi:hypothetical protein
LQPVKTLMMESRSRTGSRLLTAGLALAGLVWAIAQVVQAEADPLYAVSGITVDVTDTDASSAKLKAISQAQVKAFGVLLERLGGPEARAHLEGLQPSDIGRMMDSLSIEEERTGPGRYIGRLTIRFLPDKVRQVLAQSSVAFTEERAPAIVVVPVWLGPDGPEAWSDNPWRSGWLALNAHDTLVPLIIPLGDLTDAHTLTPEQALDGDQAALEAVRQRYSADAIIVALAAPLGETAIRASVVGETPLGRVDFDETYSTGESGFAAVAEQVAKTFHSDLLAEWRMARPYASRAAVQSISVAVPFSSLEQWNRVRAHLIMTPGVDGVDLSSLTSQGAVVRLSYSVPFSELQALLAGKQLNLALRGDTWVLQPF